MLRIGHNLLLSHVFHLELNSSINCSWHIFEAECDARYILKIFSTLATEGGNRISSPREIRMVEFVKNLLSSFFPLVIALFLNFLVYQVFQLKTKNYLVM